MMHYNDTPVPVLAVNEFVIPDSETRWVMDHDSTTRGNRFSEYWGHDAQMDC